MMKYQLIVQFPEDLYGDLEWIADLEERLAEHLPEAEIDGHDMGSGEVNIFIHTNHPVETFEVAKNVLREQGVLLEQIKVAYREMDAHHCICLWPRDLKVFNVI